MTKEEKIAELINIRDNFNYTLAPREVFDDAIKALEQDSILDRVRVAIMNETESIWNTEIIVGMKRAVDIIDRYKAETEE